MWSDYPDIWFWISALHSDPNQLQELLCTFRPHPLPGLSSPLWTLYWLTSLPGFHCSVPGFSSLQPHLYLSIPILWESHWLSMCWEVTALGKSSSSGHSHLPPVAFDSFRNRMLSSFPFRFSTFLTVQWRTLNTLYKIFWWRTCSF